MGRSGLAKLPGATTGRHPRNVAIAAPREAATHRVLDPRSTGARPGIPAHRVGPTGLLGEPTDRPGEAEGRARMTGRSEEDRLATMDRGARERLTIFLAGHDRSRRRNCRCT